MKKPTIAIDVDDVLTPTNLSMMHFVNENYGTNFAPKDYQIVAPYRMYWENVWKVSNEEAWDRYNSFVKSGAFRDMKVLDGAIEAIKQLKKKYSLLIVSARSDVQFDDTHHWLETHFPGVFDGVHFAEMWEEDKKVTKAKICQEVGAGYLVDDSVEHCNLAAEAGIHTLLFGDYGWNKAEEVHKDVVRVKDWNAVMEYFNGRH